MKWFKPIVVVFLLLGTLPVASPAATRTALVIGNGGYDSSPLANPQHDARDVAATLEKLGFEVILKTDADKGAMLRAIDDFGRRLRKAEVGLFYYAGHGMQVRGQNYLIPIQAHVTSETDVEYAAVAAGRVAGKMEEAGNAVNIIILDACRDNPFKRSFRSSSQGLARMDAAEGTFIAYATGPGSVAEDGSGRNGVFTKHLLRQMVVPRQPIETVFKQVRKDVLAETSRRQMPWQSSSLTGEFYFAASSAAVVEAPGPTVLSLTCDVSDAQVRIDGTIVGGTPLSPLSISPGRHRLQVEKQGFKPYQRTLTIDAGRTTSLSIYLEADAPRQARLYVDTAPADARVRILNISPPFTQGMALDPGRYQVAVSADDYDQRIMWVDLAAGEDKHLDIRLEAKTTTISSSEPTNRTWTEPVTGMEFVWVPGGCYQMGCGSWSDNCEDDEKPVHEVCIDGFWMGKYEVTQGQWQKVMGSNPSHFRKGDDWPVETVSWNDARRFIEKLNTRNSGQYQLLLPTEAQWEYAARSGGREEKYAGGSDIDRLAWYRANSGQTTHRVGTKAPNGLGLYDMSGNVWEWCQDVYAKDAYQSHSRNNPVVTSGGSLRVFRGGSWNHFPRYVRSANRNGGVPGGRNVNVGFRLSRQ